MKNHRHLQISGTWFPWLSKALVLSIAASLFLAASTRAQLAAPPPDDKVSPPEKESPLLGKVMTDLPHYGDAPAPVAAPKPPVEEISETVILRPFVILGEKGPKLREPQLRTDKAFTAEIFKRYDYSAFSVFQHKEDIRLQDMAEIQSYADNLMLAGDVEGGRAIKKESNRLFLRPHDPETEYVDSLFNSRIR